MLRGALQTMRLDISRWPTEQEGLALLTTKPANAEAAQGWAGPYLDEEVPAGSPGGHPYQYAPQASGKQTRSPCIRMAPMASRWEGQDADIGYVAGVAAAN